MTPERERRVFLTRQRVETTFPRTDTSEWRVLRFLYHHSGELCSFEEISQAYWDRSFNSPRLTHIRTVCSRLRKMTEGYLHLYPLARFGILLSQTDLEGEPLNLSDIGVSVFCQESGEGKKIIPGLSVLSPEILDNKLVNPNSVLKVLDRLVWGRMETGRPMLMTYIPPVERQVLACLAQGGFWSQSELDQAAGEVRRSVISSKLRRKLALAGMEISFLRSQGWLLRSKGVSGELFSSPVTSKDKVLLDFLLKEPGRLVRFEEIFSWLWGEEFSGIPEERNILAVHLKLIRKRLKEKFPQGDWHLATVEGSDSIILYQGKLGDTVPLPGLCEYRFVPKWLEEKLQPLLEKGLLNDHGVIPRFTPQERLILLRLAKMPDLSLLVEELEALLENEYSELRNPVITLRTVIHRLRRKLQDSGIKIVTNSGLGYSLEA